MSTEHLGSRNPGESIPATGFSLTESHDVRACVVGWTLRADCWHLWVDGEDWWQMFPRGLN
jgi:hypothetical protein